MSSVDCPYFEKCPICGSSEKVKLLWILAYCRTERHHECARFRLRQEDKMPDFTLLPDGTQMSPEIEAQVRAHVEECKDAEGR